MTLRHTHTRAHAPPLRAHHVDDAAGSPWSAAVAMTHPHANDGFWTLSSRHLRAWAHTHHSMLSWLPSPTARATTVRLCRTRIWQRVMSPHLRSLITACSTAVDRASRCLTAELCFATPLSAPTFAPTLRGRMLTHARARSLSQSLSLPHQGPFGDVSPLQLKTLVEDKPPEYEVFERTKAMLMVRLNRPSFCRAPLSPVLYSGGL